MPHDVTLMAKFRELAPHIDPEGQGDFSEVVLNAFFFGALSLEALIRETVDPHADLDLLLLRCRNEIEAHLFPVERVH